MLDDLTREVYCILGVPIDAIGVTAAVECIWAAAGRSAPFLLSTPNLNFLVISQENPEFRESLLLSDLSPADGVPVIWIARLLGIPLTGRTAGSDIFDALKSTRAPHKLTVFFFGGAEGVAEAAGRALNAQASGLQYVGSIFPGYGSIDAMSGDEILNRINATHADVLIAALGAQKGQLWLLRNHHRLRIPVRAHLGAALNFQAGTVKRAPPSMRKLGLEWLWRIKEEPQLWRRYFHDGIVFMRLLVFRVIPLALCGRLLRLRGLEKQDLGVWRVDNDQSITLALRGPAVSRHVDQAIASFGSALITKKPIILDLTDTCVLDARFLGLLLMLRKSLKGQGLALNLVGVSRRLKRLLRLHGAEFLLSTGSA